MTEFRSVLDILFPNFARDRVRQAVFVGEMLTDNAEPERFARLVGATLLDDPRKLILEHSGGVRLHLTRSAERYRADIVVSGKEGAAFYDDGVSVNLENIEAAVPAITDCLDELSRELGLPRKFCHCSAFVSPPGSGLPLHFDNKEVVVVQLHGTKRWRVSENREVQFPTANYSAGGRYLSHELSRYYRPGQALTDREADCAVIEMTPGRTMFLPRGYWHGTEAGCRTGSISLSFALTTPTWSAVFLERLKVALLSESHWRAPATRWGEAGGEFVPDDISAEMDRAIKALASGDLDRTLATEVRAARAPGSSGQQT